MAGDERMTIDLGKADFDEIYRGAATIAGEPIRTPPWDIGEPQPELVRLVRGGELSGRVLDVGCGPGDNAIFLAQQGFSVTAVDASGLAVESARERAAARGAEVDFRVADVMALAHRQEFDVVLDSALYHCLPAASRAEYGAALHRVAAEGARLHLFTFADAERETSLVPAAISREELRENLGRHWRIRGAELVRFSGAFDREAALRQFAQYAPAVDRERLVTDAAGRITFPMWHLRADRA